MQNSLNECALSVGRGSFFLFPSFCFFFFPEEGNQQAVYVCDAGVAVALAASGVSPPKFLDVVVFVKIVLVQQNLCGVFVANPLSK